MRWFYYTVRENEILKYDVDNVILMIKSFRDKGTEKIWNQIFSKRIQTTLGGNMDRILDVTPGEILNEEFLLSMNITAYRLAKYTNMPVTRISEIIKGRRKITADTAFRHSAYFGNSADFWLGIQDEFDLRKEKKKIEEYSPCSDLPPPPFPVE